MLPLCACSVHEVYIDDEQMAWFESVLAANQDKPIIMFTHAPPMGSGLKVVQNVHVKNRCAWLNHSDRCAGGLVGEGGEVGDHQLS